MSEPRRVDAGEARRILLDGELRTLGLMPNASNYTFLTRVEHDTGAALAIYKPQAGERPLWDFPDGTLYRREVAAFEASSWLEFDIVPPTVARTGPHGVGSVQLFVDADLDEHYLTLGPEFDDAFRLVCAFDLIINNADRKAGHCLLENETGKIWVIDHGVSFHRDPKLRTVIWDYAGQPVPLRAREAAARFAGRLVDDPGPFRELLDQEEIRALIRRANAVATLEVFPEPGSERPYPWPPV